MGLKKAINLLIDITEDPNYKELEKKTKEKIEAELEKNNEKIASRGGY